MSIGNVKRNYLIGAFILTLLIGVAGGVTYFHLVPHHYFVAYPLIPLFFLLFSYLTITLTEMCRKLSPQRLLRVYMLTRVAKILFSILFMLVYGLLIKINMRDFLLLFIANYLIYLIYDSFFFFIVEKNQKMKIKKSDEAVA